MRKNNETSKVKLAKRGDLLVAPVSEDVPPLTTAIVNRVIRRMRDRELRSAIRRLPQK
jgi:hypothetical protein